MINDFGEFAIRQHRNYGVRSTSHAEGAHSNLKRFLPNRNVDLLGLHSAITSARKRQEGHYKKRWEKERTKSTKVHRQHIYSVLRCRVSYDALNKLEIQMNLAKTWQNQPHLGRQVCSGSFTQQYGLPCSHSLAVLMENGVLIEMRSIDPHWYLFKVPMPSEEDELRYILDPVVIPRRRPTGRRHDAGVQRDRSHDELLPGRSRQRPQQPRQQHEQPSRPSQQRTDRSSKAPPKCTICGIIGHKYTSPNCPARRANNSAAFSSFSFSSVPSALPALSSVRGPYSASSPSVLFSGPTLPESPEDSHGFVSPPHRSNAGSVSISPAVDSSVESVESRTIQSCLTESCRTCQLDGYKPIRWQHET